MLLQQRGADIRYKKCLGIIILKCHRVEAVIKRGTVQCSRINDGLRLEVFTVTRPSFHISYIPCYDTE